MLRNFLHKDIIEAGCDEAGRGCLAGPVFAAAVILPKNFREPLLNDSKKLTAEERDYLRPIIEKKAVAWAVAMVDNYQIDSINILQASVLAMHNAVTLLHTQPQHLLIDGNYFRKYQSIPHTCVIEGDGKFKNIAAASILAKTHRDDFMKNLHLEFPYYLWDKNKGYSTPQHRQALLQFGESVYHRKSFNWNKYENQPELFGE